jgi:hypothetical protein
MVAIRAGAREVRVYECGAGSTPQKGAHLLNDLRILIRCRINAALKTSRDNGLELRVRHTLRNWGDGGLELPRYQRRNHAHELDGMRPRRGHQRWLAESLPCITEIAEEVLGQLVA